MNKNIKKWDQIYKDEKWDIEFPERTVQDFYRYHLPKKPKNFKILDVGCGHGVHSLYLQKKGFKVYGVDSSSTALKLAKKRLKIKKKGILKKCSFEKINFPNNYFDGAISIGVGIDFSIHITQRFREEISKNNTETALSKTLNGTGIALLGSAISSIAGFIIMGFAPMPMFASFGQLTAIMIFLALISSVFVLPSLLVMVSKKNE